MRPSLEYIKEKFEYYNKLCFDGKLPMPPIKLNLRYGQMGVTKCKIIEGPDGTSQCQDISIEISVRQDLPEEEYIDTILHEMIHYYIAYNNIKDDSSHGVFFKQKMYEIMNAHGIRITLAFNPSEEYLVNSITRLRYVCITEFKDGRMGLAVVAKNKIFQLWEQMPYLDGVKKVRWYVSNRAIFGEFPVMVMPKVVIVDSDKIHHYLSGARELENNGKTIKVKNNI